MKRCLLLALLLVSLAARAQNSRGDFSLTTATGQAVSGASVYVLQQPANTSSFTPTISIFGSSSGSGAAVCGTTGGALTDPLVTDQYGHACGYFAPGTYTVCYVSPLVGTQCYQDQVYNGASGGSVINASTMTAFQLNNEFWVAGAAVGSALLCPNGGTTQLECAANAANAWSNANSANTMLHLMPGVNTTNLGISFTSTNAPSIVGAATFGSLIRQISPISTPTVNYGCTVFASSVRLNDFQIDADFNAPSGLYLGKSQEYNTDGLVVSGAAGTGTTSNFVQIGDSACSGGGSTFEGHQDHLTVTGRGTGPGSWAVASCSGSTPSCTISAGGTYHWPSSKAYLVGYQGGTAKQPCSAMGTITPTFTTNGTWQWGQTFYSQTLSTYTMSSVALSGFSGCSGTMYLYAPDVPAQAYGIYAPFATDTVFTMPVVAGAGQTAGIENENTANNFYGMHVYNGYVGFRANGGGGHIYGMDCDSNLIMIQVVGASPIEESGCNAFYPSASRSVFNGAVMFDLSGDTNHQSSFTQNDVVGGQGATPSDWHAFLQPTGPTDENGSWPGSLNDTSSPTVNPAGNYKHDTAVNATNDTVGPEVPATAGANQISPSRLLCENLWSGTASQQNCWAFQVSGSTSGVPTQEIFNVNPPSNALAPVSGRFWLFNTPAIASGSGNFNSITIGQRGSYWDGSAAHNIGWNQIVQIGSGATPSNTWFWTPTACPGTCQISTNANIITTGTTFVQSPQFNLSNGSFTGNFTPPTLTATRTYTYPDATGAVPVAPAAITVGNAACWKATGQLGTCSTTPTGGVCTCN